MLADDLLDPKHFPLADNRSVIEALNESQRFVFDPHFTIAAMTLCRDNKDLPDNLLKIMPLCRPPYARTWLELCHGDRQAAGWPKGNLEACEIEPDRVGVLVEQMPASDSVLLLSLFWRGYGEIAPGLSDVGCSTPLISLLIDLTGKNSTVTRLRNAIDKGIAARSGGSNALAAVVAADLEIGRTEVSDVEAHDWQVVNQCVTPYPNPYGAFTIMEPVGIDALQHESFKFALSRSFADWKGEAFFWLSALAMLASRNLVTTDPGPDFTRLNKARARAKRRPLLPYRVCVIDRRLRDKIGADRHEGSVRAHFVRGHFKMRRTGIFWWKPFARGDAAKGFVKKDYRAHV